MPSTETISNLLAVCPFCGSVNNKPGKPCARCTLEDTTATRSATKSRIGPWYVLQARNPAAPGMKFETLKSLIRRGYVTPQSVVRGPTTHQLWQWAGKVRGISREFGVCYSCGSQLQSDVAECPHCNRGQLLPNDPDALLESQAVPSENANAEPDQQNPTPATEQSIEPENSSDVLTPRELAMIFQLGYDPPARDTPAPMPPSTKASPSFVVPALAAALAVFVAAWIFWPTKHAVHLAKIQPATQPSIVQPVHEMVQMIAIPVQGPPTAEVIKVIEKPVESSPTLQAQKLWNQALDAESQRNFATALQIYQRIQTFPAAVQPASLKTRLALVRRELTVGTD